MASSVLSSSEAITSAGFSQTVLDHTSRLGEVASSLTGAQLFGIVLGALILLSSFAQKKPYVSGAPVHGRQWWWEPTLWLQSRFTFGARDIVASGYKKVGVACFLVMELRLMAINSLRTAPLWSSATMSISQ